MIIYKTLHGQWENTLLFTWTRVNVDNIEINFLVFEMHYIDFNVCLKCNVKNIKHVSTMQNVKF